MVLVSVHDVALYRRASICDRITGGRLRRSSAHERSRVSASPVSPENRRAEYNVPYMRRFRLYCSACSMLYGSM